MNNSMQKQHEMSTSISKLNQSFWLCYSATYEFFQGLFSSFRLRGACRILARNDKARLRVLQTFLLNIPLLCLGLLLHFSVVASVARQITLWIYSDAEELFSRDTQWKEQVNFINNTGRQIIVFSAVVPYFLAALIISGIWASQISSAGFQQAEAQQRKVGTSPAPTGGLMAVAEAIYRALLVQAMNIYVVLIDSLIPLGILSRITAICLSALACAFAVFDTVWSFQQLPLTHRFSLFESHWSWYLGFGMPLAIATYFSNPVVNGCMYAIGFPWLVLAAIYVKPTRTDSIALPVLTPFKWIIFTVLTLLPWCARHSKAAKRTQ